MVTYLRGREPWVASDYQGPIASSHGRSSGVVVFEMLGQVYLPRPWFHWGLDHFWEENLTISLTSKKPRHSRGLARREDWRDARTKPRPLLGGEPHEDWRDAKLGIRRTSWLLARRHDPRKMASSKERAF